MTTLWRVGGVAGLVVAAAAGGAATASAQAAPTFTRDVAPILQRKCEACHRPDSIAPMSLVTYQEARPWARSIKARITEHSMPPFQIDRTVGVTKFKNDESLSDAELETIVKWVDAGAPQGDAKDLPPPVAWPDDQGWNFAKAFGQAAPDLVITSHSFTMPAQAQDAWDERVTDSGITEPRWVRAIEIRPSWSRAARSPTTPSPTCSRTTRTRRPPASFRCRSWNGRWGSRAS